ncbi:MAG: beta-N-acetylhexosaminidase [Thermacetogeniaceae bacterium]
MFRKWFLIIILLIGAAILTGYLLANGFDWPFPKQSAQQQQNDNAEEEQQEKPDPIQEQLNSLTLEEKIGQMVMVGIEGKMLGDDAKQLIQQHHVGGIILFKRNIDNPAQTLSLINELKRVNSAKKIPLFLSVDEEGGRVSRMPAQLKKLPSSGRIGEVNDSEISFEIGRLLGQELRAFGFNMDFAPVLDINSNPNNPVIGDRSFGTTPELVSRLGLQIMKGLQSQNVISVVKHFPGHGDTSVDSHIGLPSVYHDYERLKSFELIPFADAVTNNADAVMIAHILLPNIDPEHPASLSRAVITDILRKDLNFQGVVITDDLTMGAITNNYGLGEAAVKAVTAGSDIVLVCHSMEMEMQVINALTKAVEAGQISTERVDESVYRILKLKQKYQLSDEPVESVDIDQINRDIERVLSRFW